MWAPHFLARIGLQREYHRIMRQWPSDFCSLAIGARESRSWDPPDKRLKCVSDTGIGEKAPDLALDGPICVQQIGWSAKGSPRQSWPPVMGLSIHRSQPCPHRSLRGC